ILLRVNSSSVSHCGRFANSLLDLRRSARLILCIGGVLLLAGSPGWVSATPKATPPFPYFHTCWLYLSNHGPDLCRRRRDENDPPGIRVTCCRLSRANRRPPLFSHSLFTAYCADASASAIVFRGKTSFKGSSSSLTAPKRSYHSAARSLFASIASATPPTSTATESARLPAASKSSPP